MKKITQTTILILAFIGFSINSFSQIAFYERQTLETVYGEVSSSCIADLDNDGEKDIVSIIGYNSTVKWYKNQGNGNYEDGKLIGTYGGYGFKIYSADLNKDGNIDIITTSSEEIVIYKNQGNGNFSEGNIIELDFSNIRLAIADLDNDGYDDIVPVHYFKETLFWYKNDGSGNFNEKNIIENNVPDLYKVSAKDFDYDGDIDIITSHNIYKNDGEGYFIKQQVSENLYFSFAADIDNDGYTDVVFSLHEKDYFWYKNDGQGNFTKKTAVLDIDHQVIYDTKQKDLDNDGDIDIVSMSYSNYIYNSFWSENDGQGNFSNPVEIENTFVVRHERNFLIEDLDNDGDNDILSSYQDDLVWYENKLIDKLDYNIYLPENTETVKNTEIEIPVKTSMLKAEDKIYTYQFDYIFNNTKLEYKGYSLEQTLLENGAVEINSETDGKLSISYMQTTPLVGEGDIIKFKFKAIEAGTSSMIISNFKYNEKDVTNTSKGIVTVLDLNYGDVSDNGEITSFDAALALMYSVGVDPMPEVAQLPWEEWRILTANVDGEGDVTAFDAGLILKYSAGLINEFPVENNKNYKQNTNSDISVEIINNEFVFTTKSDLIGFNLEVENNSQTVLGEPIILDENMLSATKIDESSYNIGLCLANSPAVGTQFMKIPFTGEINEELTFKVKINNIEKTMKFGTMSISDKNTKEISIYPNPAKDKIKIKSSVSLENSNIEIYSISGSLMKKVSLNDKKEIDISNLAEGVYLIKIKSDKLNIVKKIVKK